MTTVAWRQGVVAFDSRLTQGGDIMTEFLTKVRLSNVHPVVYAGCGSAGQFHCAGILLDQMELLPWDNPNWQPNDNFDMEDATIMIVTAQDQVYYIEGKYWFPVEAPFCAMGSGGVAARAAMMAGASAEEAVAIACKLDTGSGLPVHTIHVSDIYTRHPILAPRPKKKKNR